ncbi:MAG: hypothetical protein KDB23_04165 [Planctomycetales bacterium]|nr:hypothetical protein [Planctomycetales bacterium]
MNSPVYAFIGLLSVCLIGCGRKPQISHYQVPHEDPVAEALANQQATAAAAPGAGAMPGATPNAPTGPQRMLALIVPVGDQAWFVKAMGSLEKVAAITADYAAFRDSLTWEAEAGPPTWTLPAGWTQSAGNQFRYATIDAAGVDLSVSSLPISKSQSPEEYYLSNVNRWRGQLQLPPLTADEFSSQTEQVEVAGHAAIAVDLIGQGSAGGPPMMASGSTGSAAASGPVANTPSASPTDAPPASNSGLDFTVPEGWRTGRLGPFRLAAYEVERDGASAEVTVSALGVNAGSLLDNVNRWRGQIKLPPIDDAALQSAIQPITVAGVAGQWIDLSDPAGGTSDDSAQAILVVVVPQSNQTLFIKMLGGRDVVVAEKDNFRRFAESLKLPAGAVN